MNTENSVSQIMTKEVITVNERDSLLKIEEIFEQNQIHHLVVMGQEGISGIVSKNDILSFLMSDQAHSKNETLSEWKVQDIMTSNPLTIESDDTIGLAADIILSNRLHSLPVLEGSELVGILTSHDLLKYSFEL